MIRNKCDDCGKNAIFNYDSERFGIRCSTHKSPKMIDVKHRKCVTCRMKRPVYNYENEKGKYCVTCKSEGMVDVENTKCLACKRKQPFFNYEDEQKGLYCFSCKLTGMVDVKSFKCTICNKRATHNYISFKEFCQYVAYPPQIALSQTIALSLGLKSIYLKSAMLDAGIPPPKSRSSLVSCESIFDSSPISKYCNF